MPSAIRTCFLTGSTKLPEAASGKTLVSQVVAPTRARTRTEPKPLGSLARSRTSSARSSGSVTKHHAPESADPSRAVQRFVNETYAAVPAGCEGEQINLDHLVTHLLAD